MSSDRSKKPITSGKRKHHPVIFSVKDMNGDNIQMVVRDQNKRKELLDSFTNEFRTTTISTEGRRRTNRSEQQQQREQQREQQSTAKETSKPVKKD